MFAVSHSYLHHGSARILVHRQANFIRYYAQQQKSREPARPDIATTKAIDTEYSCKAALEIIQSNGTSDRVNAARSTLPPPLVLPERSASQSTFIYWFNIGRAYGTFYKEGVKAVWFNYKAAKLLRERFSAKLRSKNDNDAALAGIITRAEWQLLSRSNHDIGKLPLFGLLALVFGEWLPLFVPFMPSVVPRTARIPSQVKQMREQGEERRRVSFRQGITEPASEQMPDDRVVVEGRPVAARSEWQMADAGYVQAVLTGLRQDQLMHLSTTLGLHSKLWDRIQLPPPGFILRRRLERQLTYITLDDKLLIEHEGAAKLSEVELEIACEERGLDVLEKKHAVLKDNLAWWLSRQEDVKGQGQVLLSMLFRRLAIRDWVKLHMKETRD